MKRILLTLLALLPLQALLTACDESYVRNCPVIGKDPSSNYYNLDYELLIPADCPVPLANPGTEKKYAAARILDLGTIDFTYASVKVKNSKGETVADDAVNFFGGIAEPGEEYVAATGTKTFSDHDVGIFRAWNISSSKTAYGETKLTYQQSSLSTRLSGTRIPAPNTSQTWTAPTTGGTPAYAYQWYRDGVAVGTGSSYTTNVGTTDFDLRVEVTDQTWSTRAGVLDVDVGGVGAAIAGTSQTYAATGGDTWTATGQGGTGSYTFQWYLADTLLGTGSSWSGYPGDGNHALQVRVTDSAGATASAYKLVRGIPDNGGCIPPPGQRTC